MSIAGCCDKLTRVSYRLSCNDRLLRYFVAHTEEVRVTMAPTVVLFIKYI